MKKLLVLLIALLFSTILFPQKYIGQLTFTAVDNETYIQLHSIKVMNRTQGGETVLVYPDTVLVLDGLVGNHIETLPGENRLFISQNHP